MSSQFPETICWYCRNAVPDREEDNTKGCSWSRRFEPVEGWTAIPTVMRLAYRERAKHNRRKTEDTSFIVLHCPLFVPDVRI